MLQVVPAATIALMHAKVVAPSSMASNAQTAAVPSSSPMHAFMAVLHAETEVAACAVEGIKIGSDNIATPAISILVLCNRSIVFMDFLSQV